MKEKKTSTTLPLGVAINPIAYDDIAKMGYVGKPYNPYDLSTNPFEMPNTTLNFGTYTPPEIIGSVQFDLEVRMIKVFNGKEWIEIDVVFPNETEEERKAGELKAATLKMQREIKDV